MKLLDVHYLNKIASLYDLAELISRIDAERFRSVDGFAFLCEHPVIFDADASTSAFEYARGKPIFVVFQTEGATKHDVNAVTREGFEEIADGKLVELIRDNDLSGILDRSGSNCTFEAGDGFHFIIPSLNHTTRFLRIADIIATKDTLLRLSFWLRPVVVGADAVLIDNWSMVAPILSAMYQCDYPGQYDCLPEHPASNQEKCRRVILDLTENIPDKGKLVVIVSIFGSGRLAKFIDEICESVGKGRFTIEIINLYGFESSPRTFTCWHRIKDKGLTFSGDECELCRQGSKPIILDGANYHLRAFIESPVNLRLKHFKESRPFFERYNREVGVFALHKNDANDGRHHAFGLDVERLLENAEYLNRLQEQLSAFCGFVDLIVAPQHPAARRIVEIAVSRLNIPYLLHDTLDHTALPEADCEMLRSSRAILILDDVINTGSRMRRYVQSIREGSFGGFEKVHYLAGVARPRNSREYSAHEIAFKDGHSWAGEFCCVEYICLPRFGEKDCPWCREFDFLSKIATDLIRVPDWLKFRLAQLRDRDQGIADQALLLLPNVANRNAGGDSPIFLEGAGSVVTAFQVASGLQECRGDDDPSSRLASGFPLGTVLDPSVISRRYTEGLIRGILLRLVSRQEWGNSMVRETLEAFVNAAPQTNQHIMVGELLLAFGRQSMPLVTKLEFENTFRPLLGDLTSEIAGLLGLGG